MKVGDRVRVVGLEDEWFNGKEGVIVGKTIDGKWVVEIDDPNVKNFKAAIRPKHLRPVGDSPLAEEIEKFYGQKLAEKIREIITKLEELPAEEFEELLNELKLSKRTSKRLWKGISKEFKIHGYRARFKKRGPVLFIVGQEGKKYICRRTNIKELEELLRRRGAA